MDITSYVLSKNYTLNNEFKANNNNEALFIAHRGLNTVAPENTLPAFRKAVEAGFIALETDVAVTSDGEYVLIHDSTVDRTTDGTGTVTAMTLSELKALDAGSWFSSKYADVKIPTLDEFLSFCVTANVIPMIEIKGGFSKGRLETLVDKINEYGLGKRSIIISSNINDAKNIRNYTKEQRFGLIRTNAALDQTLLDEMLQLKPNSFVNVAWDNITTSGVNTFRENGIDVGCGNNNNYSQMMTAFRNGCRQFTTDSHLLKGVY